MSSLVFLWFAISIVIIIFSILKLKLSPAIALVFGSLFMGIASGVGLTQTTATIGSGFGGIMVGIGLPIGLGVILGQLLSESGGAQVIADTIVKAASEKYALYALGLTAFLLSIPVFYDVIFIILVPLAIAMAKKLRRPIYYTVTAIIIGAGTSHTLVPPTPNPLAAAEILGFDLGVMMVVGLVIGAIASTLAMKIMFTLFNRGLWNQQKDETGMVIYEHHQEETGIQRKAPSFGLSMVPILLPVFLILMGTVSNALLDEVPTFILFLSDKMIALLLGVVSAYLITIGILTSEEKNKASAEAIKNCGMVLLVTGAGGSFGAVITATGISGILGDMLKSMSAGPVVAMGVAFVIAAVFRIALGSGTVASITAMNIMAGVAASVGIHPVWIAIACLSGSLSCGHINDSGFWVSTNLSGFTVTGGLKTYTLSCAVVAVFSMTMATLGALFLPL